LSVLRYPESIATSNALRGLDEAPERELKTIIYGRGSGGNRSRGKTLFIIEDDNSRSTAECAEDTADEFKDEFDDIIFADDDDDVSP
jgi:hypothetical protein